MPYKGGVKPNPFARAALVLLVFLLSFNVQTAWAQDLTISSAEEWNTFASAVNNGTNYNDSELAAYPKYWLDIATEKSAILGAEKRGEQSKAISIAKKTKAHGDSIEYIAEMTGLTIAEINNL